MVFHLTHYNLNKPFLKQKMDYITTQQLNKMTTK